MAITSRSVFSNMVWRFAERILSQGVGFIVSIILARIIGPDEYGLIAIVMVVTSILQVFIDSGMGTALIQKKDANDADFSTIFHFNWMMGLVLYALLYIFSPYIATFYENEELTAVLRAMGLILVVSSLRNVQQAVVSKRLEFRKFFYANSTGTILSGVIGIAMAYGGYGVWALVVQHIANILLNTIVLWFTVKWRPKLVFSSTSFHGLFSFGWKILLSKIIDTLYMNLQAMIIGKKYTQADLAYYQRAKIFPETIIANINTSIDSVLLPTMSEVQDNKTRLREMTSRSIKVSTYLMAPLMMIMFVTAEPMIRFLLTDKWMMCVPYLRIFCITFMFYPIHTANLNAIKALGRSDLFLKLEIAKKIVGVTAILLTMWHSVMAMALSGLVVSVLSQIINSWPNKRLLDYSYLEQLRDIMPNITASIVMAFCIYWITLLRLPDFCVLIMQLIAGLILYIALSKIMKLDSFEYVLSLLFRNKKRKL